MVSSTLEDLTHKMEGEPSEKRGQMGSDAWNSTAFNM